MTRVDLDATQASAEYVMREGDYDRAMALVTYTLPALAAELRAARDVAEAARKVTKAPRMYRSEDKALVAVLAAYDQAVGP